MGQPHVASPLDGPSHVASPLDEQSLPRAAKDAIYRHALELLALRPAAVRELRERGLSDDDIERWSFKSLPRRGREHASFMVRMRAEWGEQLVACPGFRDKNHRLTFWAAGPNRDGYIVPYINEAGQVVGIQAKVLGGKYLNPRGPGFKDAYCVAGLRTDLLYVTEGGLKAIVASALGPAWVLGVPGLTLSESHLDTIAYLHPEGVAVALDRERNRATSAARRDWMHKLLETGLPVYEAVWEPT
jgi:hypothetical protein